MKLKEIFQTQAQLEEENLKNLYERHGIEKFYYDYIWDKELYIFFKDKNFFKFKLRADKIMCFYLIKTLEAKEKYPYDDTNNGADISANVSVCVKPNYEKKFREDINQSTNYIRELEDVSAYIDDNYYKKNRIIYTKDDLLSDFYTKIDGINNLFASAQHYYHADGYMHNPPKEEKIPAHPLIESRYIFELFYGYYLGKQEEIRDRLEGRVK